MCIDNSTNERETNEKVKKSYHTYSDANRKSHGFGSSHMQL